MAIMAAPSSGAMASRVFDKSVLGLKTCVCPAKKRARNPKPAKERDE
jgi:hypothetical protein